MLHPSRLKRLLRRLPYLIQNPGSKRGLVLWQKTPVVLLHHIRRVLDRIACLLVRSCLLEYMGGQDIAKVIPVDRRRHRDRETRLLAISGALTIAAETGLKEHDRLVLARQMMMRKLEGRRTSSRLPELMALVMARPLISAGMVAKTLEVTPQGARRIVQELGLREMTGRGRFRAWGVVCRRLNLSSEAL